jgi:hypothetical protein
VRREFDWGSTFGAEGLVMALKRIGYSGQDIRAHVALLKEHQYEDLNRFAGDELSKAKGLPCYPALLEATALRFILGEKHANVAIRPDDVFCPHGYAQSRCATCMRGAA